MGYVDVVTVRLSRGPLTNGQLVLRTAPKWSYLTVGTEVMFEIAEHPYEMKGTVEDVATFNVESEEYRLLKSFAKDLDMHITKRIEYKTYEYGKGENDG